jgi:molybdenum cofactor cytidylyltransferase
MTLSEALRIRFGDCVAVVGAGGKTTLCWRLVQEAAARNGRAIFTTTTKIWQPAEGVFHLVRVGNLADIRATLVYSADWRTACLAASVEGSANLAPVNGAGMPAVQTKLVGFAANEVCDLKSLSADPLVSIFVEADGARGLCVKAPGDSEPVIPPCADVVCVLASLDAIGHPLDERIAHRVDRVARLTSMAPGDIVTASVIAGLLAHPEGGLKGIPAGARRIAVLTQRSACGAHPDAMWIMAELVRHSFDRAVTLALHAAQPIVAVVDGGARAP